MPSPENPVPMTRARVCTGAAVVPASAVGSTMVMPPKYPIPPVSD